MLAERLDLSTMELCMFIHKHTGHNLDGAALDELRRHLSWQIAMSAAAVIDRGKIDVK